MDWLIYFALISVCLALLVSITYSTFICYKHSGAFTALRATALVSFVQKAAQKPTTRNYMWKASQQQTKDIESLQFKPLQELRHLLYRIRVHLWPDPVKAKKGKRRKFKKKSGWRRCTCKRGRDRKRRPKRNKINKIMNQQVLYNASGNGSTRKPELAQSLVCSTANCTSHSPKQKESTKTWNGQWASSNQAASNHSKRKRIHQKSNKKAKQKNQQGSHDQVNSITSIKEAAHMIQPSQANTIVPHKPRQQQSSSITSGCEPVTERPSAIAIENTSMPQCHSSHMHTNLHSMCMQCHSYYVTHSDQCIALLVQPKIYYILLLPPLPIRDTDCELDKSHIQ